MMALIFLCLASAFPASAMTLPEDVDDWHAVSEFVVPLVLDLNSEDVGRCVYKNYLRQVPRGSVEIILTEGTGPGILRVPDASDRNSDNSKVAMEADSGYKTLDVSGHRAILETYEILPMALAISISPNVTLTLESISLSEDELVDLARKFIN